MIPIVGWRRAAATLLSAVFASLLLPAGLLSAALPAATWAAVPARPAPARPSVTTPNPLRLMVPAAHQGYVESLAAASNGEWVATGGGDQRIHLWHVPTRRQWRSLDGHRATVGTLAFNGRGDLLASGDNDGLVQVWRVADGQLLCSWMHRDDRDQDFPPRDQQTQRVGWDNDGRVWAAGQAGLLRLWEVSGCREAARLSLTKDTTWDVARERDGWTVATHDAVLRLDATGTPRWRLPLPTYPRALARPFPGGQAVLLNDNRVIEFDDQGQASAAPATRLDGMQPDLIGIPGAWLAAGASRVLTLHEAGRSRDLNVLDRPGPTGSGRLSTLNRVAVAGQRIVAAGPGGLLILNGRSLATEALIEVPDAPSYQVLIADAPRRRLVVAGISGTQWWDLAAGRPGARLTLPDNAQVRAGQFSADGRTLWLLAVRGKTRLLKLDADSGRVLARADLSDLGFELTLDAAGERVVVAARGGALAFHMTDLRPLGRLGALDYAERIDSVAGDRGATGRLLVSNPNRAELIDLADGRVLQRWGIDDDAFRAAHGGFIVGARLAARGRAVWFAAHNGVTAFAADDGQRLWRTALPDDFRRTLARDATHSRLLVYGSTGAVLEAHGGAARPLTLPLAADAGVQLDERNSILLGADSTLRLWQVTPDESRPAASHPSTPHPSTPRPSALRTAGAAAAPAPGPTEGLAALLEWRTLQPPQNPCSVGPGLCRTPPPWIVTTGDGRFDLSNFAELPDLAWYAAGAPLEPMALEWFARRAFTPRLLGRALAGQIAPLPAPLTATRVVPPRVTDLNVSPAGNDPRVVRVAATITPGATPLAAVLLYRDGMRVARLETRALQRAGDSWRATFMDVRTRGFGLYEPVQFEAVAVDTAGIRSSPVRLTHKVTGADAPGVAAARPSRTWLLHIGVNTHDNPAFNLTFAAADARRLGTVLAQRMQRDWPDSVVQVSLIAEGDARAASKARIREALQILAGAAPRSRDAQLAALDRAGPDDRVFISFAGHGLVGPDGEFYLLPSDTGPGPARGITPALLQRAIASRELTQWLDGLDAGHVTLVLDACHAAAAVDASGFVPGPMDSAGLGQLAYDKGFAVLVATQADDVALESGRLQHGVLTYALAVEGLEQGQADHAPRDDRTERLEWLRYGVSRVPELAGALRRGELPGKVGDRAARLTGQAAGPPPAQTPSLFHFGRAALDMTVDRRN